MFAVGPGRSLAVWKSNRALELLDRCGKALTSCTTGMNISEIFYSIQGEGILAGVPSVFIRTTGCNLRCTWCDTPYTSWDAEAGEALSADEILERLTDFDTSYAVLTGGEPMIARDVGEVTVRLKEAGYHLTIETAATVWRDVTCDLASISPKLANSTPWTRGEGAWADAHESNRMQLDIVRQFMEIAEYQIKFVVEHPDDMVEIDSVLSRLGSYKPTNILLMPQARSQEELDERSPWLAELCKDRGFRYCPRLQITLFGNRRKT